MILERMQVKNFRQYFGEQALEFCSGPRGVTVINGTTGAGKTNLFSAINWCLYGPENAGQHHGELVNKHALALEKSVDTEVEIHFRHKDPEGESSYVARRSARDPQILHLSRVTRRGLEPLPNPSLVLNTILSKNVRTYFFFDGERIDEFAKPEHESQVKDAVYSVLQLEVLDRSRQHLSAIADEYERELKKMDTGEMVQELIKHRHEKVDAKAEAEKAAEEARKESNAVQAVIKGLDEELSTQREVQADVLQRQRLEAQQQTFEQELDRILEDIRDLGSAGYLLVGSAAIEKAIAIIDEKRQRGEIPAGIREQFIRDLIEKEMCICGRPITHEGHEQKTLEALLNRSIPSGIENRLLEAGGLLRGLKSRIELNRRGLQASKGRKAQLEDELNRITKEADEIGDRLKNVGIQEVEALESKRQAALRKANELHITIGTQDERIRDLDRAIKGLDDVLKKAQGLEGKAKTTQQKLALARDSSEAVADVHEEFAKVMRAKIEEEAQKIFALLIWKESQFPKIELTSDYQLTVLDRWGAPARPELSAGERQLLSLSFIMALSRASDGSAPLVMDTPFGRLDSKPRENICEHLPQMVDQLVLFVTSEELHGKARELLKPYIGREYTLKWDKTTGCTAIIPQRTTA